MDVVQQLDAVAERLPQRGEEARHHAHIWGRLPDALGARVGVEGHAATGAVRALDIARRADLRPDRAIAQLPQPLGVLDRRLDVLARGMPVAEHPIASATTQE